ARSRRSSLASWLHWTKGAISGRRRSRASRLPRRASRSSSPPDAARCSVANATSRASGSPARSRTPRDARPSRSGHASHSSSAASFSTTAGRRLPSRSSRGRNPFRNALETLRAHDLDPRLAPALHNGLAYAAICAADLGLAATELDAASRDALRLRIPLMRAYAVYNRSILFELRDEVDHAVRAIED